MPASCGVWRRELVMERDKVAMWAQDNVVQGDGYFLLKDAHRLYSVAMVDPKLGKIKLSQRLQKGVSTAIRR